LKLKDQQLKRQKKKQKAIRPENQPIESKRNGFCEVLKE